MKIYKHSSCRAYDLCIVIIPKPKNTDAKLMKYNNTSPDTAEPCMHNARIINCVEGVSDNIHPRSGRIILSSIHMNPSSINIDSSLNNVNNSSLNMDSSLNSVDNSSLNIDLSFLNVNYYSLNIDSFSNNVNYSSLNIDSSLLNVDYSYVNIDTPWLNIDFSSRKYYIASYNHLLVQLNIH
jgi:hypothetical protein